MAGYTYVLTTQAGEYKDLQISVNPFSKEGAEVTHYDSPKHAAQGILDLLATDVTTVISRQELSIIRSLLGDDFSEWRERNIFEEVVIEQANASHVEEMDAGVSYISSPDIERQTFVFIRGPLHDFRLRVVESH